MTTPVWPAYAKILSAGFGEEPESAVLRTAMEDGPAKQRRVKSRVLVQRSVTVQFNTLAEYSAFKAWFASVAGANKGSAWFDWRDPVDTVTKSARITGGTISGKPLGGVFGAWRVETALETWDA